MVSDSLLAAVGDHMSLLQESRAVSATWWLILSQMESDIDCWNNWTLTLHCGGSDIPLGIPAEEMQDAIYKVLLAKAEQVEDQMQVLLQELRDQLVNSPELLAGPRQLPAASLDGVGEPTPPPHPRAASLGRPE